MIVREPYVFSVLFHIKGENVMLQLHASNDSYCSKLGIITCSKLEEMSFCWFGVIDNLRYLDYCKTKRELYFHVRLSLIILPVFHQFAHSHCKITFAMAILFHH